MNIQCSVARVGERAHAHSFRCRLGLRARTTQPRASLHERTLTSERTTFASPFILACLVSASLPALADEAVISASQPDNGWLSPIVDSLDFVLSNIETFYTGLGLPYAFGWSIVSLTAFAKICTLPLTKKQVESALSVQALKPRIDIIKERYGDDKDKIQKETSRLYEQASVDPLAGCLPSLLQIPIFIGLFRLLNNVALSGTLDNEGFFWIPSLAGPVSASARLDGGGTAWLFPFVNGAPPIGWEEASLYLVLPVLLVLAQYASSAIISPIDPNNENANTQRALIYFLPLTIGYFSLTVPSGLSLYYFSNSFFTSAQQIYFRKLGGATVDTPDLGPVKKLGMGRRAGPVVMPPKAASALPTFEGNDALAAEFGASLPGGAPSFPVGGEALGEPRTSAAPAQEGNAVAKVDSGAQAVASNGASAVGTNGGDNGNGSEGASQTGGIEETVVGGLQVVEGDMEGVDAAELAVLSRRCKRKKKKVKRKQAVAA